MLANKHLVLHAYGTTAACADTVSVSHIPLRLIRCLNSDTIPKYPSVFVTIAREYSRNKLSQRGWRGD
eukprot:Nitzschia sp. Nitz4//scaffold33_size148984//105626//105829//NITZ4_002939-RA/size148984-exonerate_protein2genome-gene-0.50-mRNA-1//1//CDS//3329548460//3250//frame0